MNTLRKILVGAGGAVLLAGLGTAAHAADATASTSATIVRAIAIAKNTDMAFGTIVRPASNATVTLGTDGNVTGVTTVASSTRSAAQFTVTGEGGQTFSISETASLTGPSASSLTLTLTKAATTGTISSTGSGGTGTLTGALGDTADGSVVLKYGASFPITASTTTGAYNGSLVVTVDYN